MDAEAGVNVVDDYGFMPLILTAFFGRNAANNDYCTPLMKVALNERVGMAAFLLKFGASYPSSYFVETWGDLSINEKSNFKLLLFIAASPNET